MNDVKRSEGWRNKTFDQFTDAELNDYYITNMRSGSLHVSGGLVYVACESFWFPSYRNKPSTPEQRKLIERVAKEYAKGVREAGYKTKSVKKHIGGGEDFNAITVYKRETPDANISKIPDYDMYYFEHLTKFTNVPMKKILKNR